MCVEVIPFPAEIQDDLWVETHGPWQERSPSQNLVRDFQRNWVPRSHFSPCRRSEFRGQEPRNGWTSFPTSSEYILIWSSCLLRILYFNFMWSLTSFPFSLSRDFQIFISPTRPVRCKAPGIYELLAAPAAHDGIY